MSTTGFLNRTVYNRADEEIADIGATVPSDLLTIYENACCDGLGMTLYSDREGDAIAVLWEDEWMEWEVVYTKEPA